MSFTPYKEFTTARLSYVLSKCRYPLGQRTFAFMNNRILADYISLENTGFKIDKESKDMFILSAHIRMVRRSRYFKISNTGTELISAITERLSLR